MRRRLREIGLDPSRKNPLGGLDPICGSLRRRHAERRTALKVDGNGVGRAVRSVGEECFCSGERKAVASVVERRARDLGARLREGADRSYEQVEVNLVQDTAAVHAGRWTMAKKHGWIQNPADATLIPAKVRSFLTWIVTVDVFSNHGTALWKTTERQSSHPCSYPAAMCCFLRNPAFAPWLQATVTKVWQTALKERKDRILPSTLQCLFVS